MLYKAFEKELEQFMFMCDEDDRHIFNSPYRKKYVEKYVRLSYVAAVFGYKRVYLAIVKKLEYDMDYLIDTIEKTYNDFDFLNNWISDFIERIQDKYAKNIAAEFWEEEKADIDIAKFSFKKYFKR